MPHSRVRFSLFLSACAVVIEFVECIGTVATEVFLRERGFLGVLREIAFQFRTPVLVPAFLECAFEVAHHALIRIGHVESSVM